MGLRWRECSSLTDVFELSGDGFDDGAFAQEEHVRPVKQPVMHLFAQFGDELKPVGDQQLLGQRLREIAFGAKELAHQAFRELEEQVSDHRHCPESSRTPGSRLDR